MFFPWHVLPLLDFLGKQTDWAVFLTILCSIPTCPYAQELAYQRVPGVELRRDLRKFVAVRRTAAR